MEPNFAIGIPTLNRFDLLHPALEYYQHDFPETRIYLVDNGKQILWKSLRTSRVPMVFYTPNTNMGVASSWNWLINKIFNDSSINYSVILNDDIYWGREQEDFNLFLAEFERAQEKVQGIEKGFILAPTESKYDWCVFVISRAAWETIGEFDENFFPAYFEDCDYKYRAKLAGIAIHKILRGPARFVSSGTMQKNKSLLDNTEKNRAYYISKWGGEPGKEIYTQPFNGENKPL